MSGWTRFGRAVMLAVLVLLAVSACGVPRNEEARTIADQEPVEVVPSASVPGGSVARKVFLYFVAEDRLERVQRPTDGSSDLSAALRTLLGGLAPEDGRDLVSSIPPDTRLLGQSRPDEGVLTLDLSTELAGITGDTFKQACAQFVFTATEFETVERVAFRIEGKAIAVPTDEGNLEVVRRADFEDLTPTLG